MLGVDWQDTQSGKARALAKKSGVTYPLVVDPSRAIRASFLPRLVLVDADGRIAYEEYVEIKSARPSSRSSSRSTWGSPCEHPQNPRAARTPPGARVSDLPEWLARIRDACATIAGDDLTRFLPPEDAGARPGAVLMLFGEGDRGPDLLLTERAHDMRSHPGRSPSRAARSTTPTSRRSRPRCARRRRRSGSTRPASTSSPRCRSSGCRRATSRSRPVLAWWRERVPDRRGRPARGARRAPGAARGAARSRRTG